MPDSIMPSFRFPEDDFQCITAYLASLKTPPQLAGGQETYHALCAALPRRKGRWQRQGGLVSRPLAARLHQGRAS